MDIKMHLVITTPGGREINPFSSTGYKEYPPTETLQEVAVRLDPDVITQLRGMFGNTSADAHLGPAELAAQYTPAELAAALSAGFAKK